MYGKLRRTDFLPVGPEKADEVCLRGIDSETSDEDEIGMEDAFHGFSDPEASEEDELGMDIYLEGQSDVSSEENIAEVLQSADVWPDIERDASYCLPQDFCD